MDRCTIVHRISGERRELAVLRATLTEIELRWPLGVALRFRCRDGAGLRDAASWQLAEPSLSAVRKMVGWIEPSIGHEGSGR